MYLKYLCHVLKENNWYVRVWYGGSLYDVSMLDQPVPKPVKETYLHQQVKLARDMVVDVYVAKNSTPKTRDQIRRACFISQLLE